LICIFLSPLYTYFIYTIYVFYKINLNNVKTILDERKAKTRERNEKRIALQKENSILKSLSSSN